MSSLLPTPYRYPESLSTLLLGVILLDSVNLNYAAEKVTARDSAAVKMLLEKTEWTSEPDTKQWYERLQQAKFDPEFWKSLSVRDALRLDYKDFANGELGISSVLMKMKDFLSNQESVCQSIVEYLTETGTDYLVIMLAHEVPDDGGGLQRELIVCGKASLEPFVEFLQAREGLELVENKECFPNDRAEHIRMYSQGNAKLSRKNLAPILLEFFGATP